MTGDEARAVLIVAALLAGASGSAGFVGGRMTAPVPPAEVRYVTIEVPTSLAPTRPADVAPIEPPAISPLDEEPAPVAPIEPQAATAAPVEVKPSAKPKAEPKPKAQPKPEKAIVKKPRPAASRQRKPTESECAQMRFYGRSAAQIGGRARGYSDDQIERALRDCGL